MADLVADSGRGRVSARAAEVVNNHAAWKAAAKVRRAALKARVEARKYGREEDEDAVPGKDEGVAAAKEGTAAPPDEEDVQPNPDAPPDAGAGAGAEDEEDEHGFNYSQRVDTSKFTVQVRIGPNGETIVDEQSLFVDRAGGEDDTAGYTHIEESDLTKFVNSMTHSKKPGGSRWSAEETELFFDVGVSAAPGRRRVDPALQALRQFGENYELLALVLPGRDRKACRNKFKAEDKRSTNRINWCLNNRLSYGSSPRFLCPRRRWLTARPQTSRRCRA
jgi:transcription factor TFIIIB component B''